MADLNLRGIDPKLKSQLKVRSAQAGQTLTEYCFAILGSSNRGEVQMAERGSPKPDVASSTLAAPAKPVIRAALDVPKAVAKAKLTKGCPSCGSIGGLHQKGCKGA